MHAPSTTDRLHLIETKYAHVREGDYFALLEISRDATAQDIHEAHVRWSACFDRMRFSEEDALVVQPKQIAIRVVLDEAYRILIDENRRIAYRNAIESLKDR